MKQITPLLVSILFFAGCTSSDVKQTAGGLETVSALAVALPLIPFAEAYHGISGDTKKAAKKMEDLRARLDPVYEARITLITQREPLVDARTLQESGVIALLPSVPEFDYYPGLESSAYDLSGFDQNAVVVRKTGLLSYLQDLMSRDPSEKEIEKDGIIYISPTYQRFQKASWAYKTTFNREMYRRKKEQTKEPNQALEPTSTAVTPPADAGDRASGTRGSP